MFKDWIQLRKYCPDGFNFPKKNQKVLVRTVHSEIWVMVFREGAKINSNYFEIASYTGNIRFQPYYLDSILQWHPIPGDEH